LIAEHHRFFLLSATSKERESFINAPPFAGATIAG